MDEKRVWVLKKTGSPVDCGVLGLSGCSRCNDVSGASAAPFPQLLAIVESLALRVLAAIIAASYIAGGKDFALPRLERPPRTQ
jgi:hypothetical protein